jgi:acetyl esterase/lipase
MITRATTLTLLLVSPVPAGMAAAPVATQEMQRQAPPAEPPLPPTGGKPVKVIDPAAPSRLAQDRVSIVHDVVYATAPADDGRTVELLMDVVFPKVSGTEPLPVVVYIHGGGYRRGSREAGLRPTIGFALGGYVGVIIDYRLSGDAKYPAAVHDCKAAIRFLRANAGPLGIDPDRIGVWGHSAGGHLSALLGASGGVEALEGSIGTAGVPSHVQCVVTVSGPSDFNPLIERVEAVEGWFGGMPEERAAKMRQASPVTHIDPRDPPFLIVHGTDDRLVPIRQAELLHEALRKTGVKSELVRVEGERHAIRDAETLLRIAAFFDEHLEGNAHREISEQMTIDESWRGEGPRVEQRRRRPADSPPVAPPGAPGAPGAGDPPPPPNPPER